MLRAAGFAALHTWKGLRRMDGQRHTQLPSSLIIFEMRSWHAGQVKCVNFCSSSFFGSDHNSFKDFD